MSEKSKYIVDYSEKAAKGLLREVVGREAEQRRVMHILLRSLKNNPMLLGPTGIGKTSIIEGVAKALTDGRVPPKLKEYKVVGIDVASMMIDSKTFAEYEENLKLAFQEIQASNGKSLLFINDISFLAKTPSGNQEIPKFLKPKVLDGGIRCIVEAELNAFKLYLEQDPDLMSVLQTMYIEEPTQTETLNILKGLTPSFEQKYGIKIPEEVLKNTVGMSARYVKQRLFPEKALDLLDEAGAGLMMAIDEGETTNKVLRDEDISKIVSFWTGIPLDKVDAQDKQRLIEVENYLGRRVIGQPEAVSVIAGAIRRTKSGLQDPNRPLGTFLFIGTTGTGKTELAKALAEFMFDDESALLRLDMSEYMEKQSVSRLLGPPPGTPGFEQGGVLTESVRLRPYQVVLFDELEKAHSEILNLMLQLLDEGRLTDGKGTTVDFRNTVVIMTSNLGANLPRYQRMEFLRQNLRPEFLARIDDIVPFHGLAEENLLAIVDIHLNKFIKRAKAVNVNAEITLEARKWFADEVFIAKNGVREIKRLIQHQIENPLSVMMMHDQVNEDSLVKIIRPKVGKGVQILVLSPEEQNKEIEEAVTIEVKFDESDDAPPPPPTFKLNEDENTNSDLPAWKRAALEAERQQGGAKTEEAQKQMVKVPVKTFTRLKVPVKAPGTAGAAPTAPAPTSPGLEVLDVPAPTSEMPDSPVMEETSKEVPAAEPPMVEISAEETIPAVEVPGVEFPAAEDTSFSGVPSVDVPVAEVPAVELPSSTVPEEPSVEIPPPAVPPPDEA